ncbi:MAG: DUF2752 domain-containing protein [Actinomycetota bacterium]|nr:DUF2752 domain-containing protein [Actinomycetota bacterium]
MVASRRELPPSAGRRVLAARLDVDLRPFRYLGAGMLALGLALPHTPGNPGLPCPLKTLTGVPCPMCGMTTSVKAALAGQLHRAVVANPVGVLAIAIAVALVVVPGWRRQRVPTVALAGGAALSWLFQLHRFHFL